MIGASMSKQWRDYPPILTTDQVAELLQVSYRSVLRMIDDGRLQALRMGREWRFSKRHIMEFIGDDPDDGVTEDGEQ